MNMNRLHKTAAVFPVRFLHLVFQHGATCSSVFFVLFLFLVKTPIVSIANKCTCRLLFLPLRVAITEMMMMMYLFSSAWVHMRRWRSLFLKEKLNRNRKKSWEDIEKLRCTVSPADTDKESQSEQVSF